MVFQGYVRQDTTVRQGPSPGEMLCVQMATTVLKALTYQPDAQR